MTNPVAPILDRVCPGQERAPIVRLIWVLLLLVLVGCGSKREDPEARRRAYLKQLEGRIDEERGSRRIALVEEYLKASGESSEALQRAARVFDKEGEDERALESYRKLVLRREARPDDKLRAAELIYSTSGYKPPSDLDLWHTGVALVTDTLKSGESCRRRALLVNYYRGHPDERREIEMALSRCFRDFEQGRWLWRLGELATSDGDRARYYCLSVMHIADANLVFIEECLRLGNHLPPQDWTVQIARGLALQEKDPTAALAILEPLLSTRDDLVDPNEVLAGLAYDAGRRELACQALARGYRANLKAVAHSTDPEERERAGAWGAVEFGAYGCERPK